MRYLSHIIGTKGFLHSLERSIQIVRRYSFGKRRFSDMVSFLENGFSETGTKVTFCVTASLLEGHSAFFNHLRSAGHQVAAHGYFHFDFKRKPVSTQAEAIKKSFEAFRRHGMPVKGFRCPYLSYDSNTIEALSSSDYSWTSNDVVFWDRGRDWNSVKKLGSLYRTIDANVSLSLPFHSGRMIEIPITAPDDEMIFERYRVKRRGEMTEIWTNIFRRAYLRGELFHLLFHPERFPFLKDSIMDVIRQSRMFAPPVWPASLNEIACWWAARGKSLWSKSERWITLDAPQGATVLIRSSKGGNHFYKDYVIKERSLKDGRFSFETRNPSNHIVTVSEDCHKGVSEFLSMEGFFVERRKSPPPGALFISGYADFKETDRMKLLDRIDDSGYPLLRLWRWPRGARCAFTVSSDVDSIMFSDFFKRLIYF